MSNGLGGSAHRKVRRRAAAEGVYVYEAAVREVTRGNSFEEMRTIDGWMVLCVIQFVREERQA
eukprot:2032382-Pleurochrysis_carterae.AAC.4